MGESAFVPPGTRSVCSELLANDMFLIGTVTCEPNGHDDSLNLLAVFEFTSVSLLIFSKKEKSAQWRFVGVRFVLLEESLSRFLIFFSYFSRPSSSLSLKGSFFPLNQERNRIQTAGDDLDSSCNIQC